MPPHSSRPRRHLINGQSCPVRGPFILALGDARLLGRRAPHWADCASGSPSKLPGCWHAAAPWTLPRQHLVFFGFISSSGRQAPPPGRSLNTALIFLRPWPCPRFTGKPQTLPDRPGLWPQESPGSSSSHGRGAGGRRPQTPFLGEPRGGAVHFADGETGGWKGVPGCRCAGLCPFSLQAAAPTGDMPAHRPQRDLCHGQARRGDLLPHIPFD